jgi:hypothetical protein
MDHADAMRRESPSSLFVEGKLRCPRCGSVRDILDYFTFDCPEQYADELNRVYKCRARVTRNGHQEPCRFIFSPGLRTEELLRAA